jgi:hypothetical protein
MYELGEDEFALGFRHGGGCSWVGGYVSEKSGMGEVDSALGSGHRDIGVRATK